MDFAPIVLFVYNRPWHTRQTVEALKKNNLAKDSNLFIFSDGPKNEEDIRDIEKVRKYIKTIDGFKNINIIEREKNYGLANSIINGITEIVNRYGKIIVLEDDCVPSDNFIAFMEKCFDKYENNEKVMNVTGYSLPINISSDYPYDIYFSYRSSSWGWGTWRRAWQCFERNKSILEEIKKSSNLRKKINRAGEDLIPMLKNQIDGKLDSWAVFWSINIIKNDGVCVNPIKSKIKNIGHDRTGIHCGLSNRYIVKTIKEDISLLNLPDEIIINDIIVKRYKKFFSPSLKNKVKKILSNILKLMGLYNFVKKLNR
ncbi:MAG: glycosyltransferase [Promethearchaeota archaeon]